MNTIRRERSNSCSSIYSESDSASVSSASSRHSNSYTPLSRPSRPTSTDFSFHTPTYAESNRPRRNLYPSPFSFTNPIPQNHSAPIQIESPYNLSTFNRLNLGSTARLINSPFTSTLGHIVSLLYCGGFASLIAGFTLFQHSLNHYWWHNQYARLQY